MQYGRHRNADERGFSNLRPVVCIAAVQPPLVAALPRRVHWCLFVAQIFVKLTSRIL
ncbi:hypothetical protein SBA4_3680003 [Candidatus Sulfopaludibacter sp. SbA4]|nr:hypothetical protein SBA4_3680003 [Candidatus Sulfopaludibacter sp. SbA4]